MKKVMLIILTIVLAVFLISCSNGKNTPAQPQEQTNTPDAPTTSTEEVVPTEVTTASTAATEPVYTQTPPVPQTPVAVVGGSVDLGPEYADGDYCVYSATVYGENGNYAGSFALSYLKFL